MHSAADLVWLSNYCGCCDWQSCKGTKIAQPLISGASQFFDEPDLCCQQYRRLVVRNRACNKQGRPWFQIWFSLIYVYVYVYVYGNLYSTCEVPLQLQMLASRNCPISDRSRLPTQSPPFRLKPLLSLACRWRIWVSWALFKGFAPTLWQDSPV